MVLILDLLHRQAPGTLLRNFDPWYMVFNWTACHRLTETPQSPRYGGPETIRHGTVWHIFPLHWMPMPIKITRQCLSYTRHVQTVTDSPLCYCFATVRHYIPLSKYGNSCKNHAKGIGIKTSTSKPVSLYFQIWQYPRVYFYKCSWNHAFKQLWS